MGYNSPYAVTVDVSTGNVLPTTGVKGATPGSTQAGQAVMYLNASGTFSQGLVDANGNFMCRLVSASGADLNVYAGQTPTTPATQYGRLIFGRQDLPTSLYQPVLMDPIGSVQAHLKSKITFRAIIQSVATSANKSLLSLVNSGTNVIRLSEAWVYVPPQQSSGTLLGTSGGTTYYPLLCEIRKITGQTAKTGTSASTQITPVSADSQDTLDANVIIYSNATLSGSAANPWHVGDAILSTQNQWPLYGRYDANEKTLVIRPGEGFSLTCLSSGTISSGSTTVQNVPVNVEISATQASA